MEVTEGELCVFKKSINFLILVIMTIAIIASFSIVASAELNVVHSTTVYTDNEVGTGGGIVSPADSFNLSEKLVDNCVTFTITPNAGFVLSELKYNNEVIIPSGNNPYTFVIDVVSMNITDLSKLDVYFVTETVSPPSVATYEYGYASLLKDTVTIEGETNTIHNRVTLFGVLNPNGNTSFKYGVLLKKDDASYESIASTDMIVGAKGVSKYPAQSPYILPYYLYGVSLYGSMLNEGMFYVRPYVEYTSGSETIYSYGKVVATILQNPQPIVETNLLSEYGTPLTNTENADLETPSSTETESDIDTTENSGTTETTTTTENAATTDTVAPLTTEGGAQ